MSFETPPPKKMPDPGFYYHYKHDPKGAINNYAYYIYGAGHHTEERGQLFLIYRPLYDCAYVYQHGKMFDVRPLDMFFDIVEVNGEKVQRFQKITDESIMTQLEEIRMRMYGIAAVQMGV